jgi:hypothetical protein
MRGGIFINETNTYRTELLAPPFLQGMKRINISLEMQGARIITPGIYAGDNKGNIAGPLSHDSGAGLKSICRVPFLPRPQGY